jgi:hypothetical protein
LRPASEHHPAVDHEHLAGDVAGQVGRQEQHGVGDILGATPPTAGDRL